jgi:hypothetical protein
MENGALQERSARTVRQRDHRMLTALSFPVHRIRQQYRLERMRCVERSTLILSLQ